MGWHMQRLTLKLGIKVSPVPHPLVGLVCIYVQSLFFVKSFVVFSWCSSVFPPKWNFIPLHFLPAISCIWVQLISSGVTGPSFSSPNWEKKHFFTVLALCMGALSCWNRGNINCCHKDGRTQFRQEGDFKRNIYSLSLFVQTPDCLVIHQI